MEQKYNLALIPLFKNNQVRLLAQKFSTYADKYILGEKSLPHVTLYQFRIAEDTTNHLWNRICKKWEEPPITLEFNTFSFTKNDKDIFWIALLPNQRNILDKMHTQIANILQLPVKTAFDPHMTLINSKNIESETAIPAVADSYKPIKDNFVLSLGKSDEVGQLTEIIYRF
jgi:2'-5' RNA ligase